MQNYAITNKLTPFISMQNHYNVVYREEEREMIPTLKVCSTHILSSLCDRIGLSRSITALGLSRGPPWLEAS
jgi:aryl-alcohol dehydrogenase-like predicted oxidoreductase